MSRSLPTGVATVLCPDREGTTLLFHELGRYHADALAAVA